MRPPSQLGPFGENAFALYSLLFMLGAYGSMSRATLLPRPPQRRSLRAGTRVLQVVNCWPALVAPALAVFSVVCRVLPVTCSCMGFPGVRQIG